MPLLLFELLFRGQTGIGRGRELKTHVSSQMHDGFAMDGCDLLRLRLFEDSFRRRHWSHGTGLLNNLDGNGRGLTAGGG